MSTNLQLLSEIVEVNKIKKELESLKQSVSKDIDTEKNKLTKEAADEIGIIDSLLADQRKKDTKKMTIKEKKEIGQDEEIGDISDAMVVRTKKDMDGIFDAMVVRTKKENEDMDGISNTMDGEYKEMRNENLNINIQVTKKINSFMRAIDDIDERVIIFYHQIDNELEINFNKIRELFNRYLYLMKKISSLEEKEDNPIYIKKYYDTCVSSKKKLLEYRRDNKDPTSFERFTRNTILKSPVLKNMRNEQENIQNFLINYSSYYNNLYDMLSNDNSHYRTISQTSFEILKNATLIHIDTLYSLWKKIVGENMINKEYEFYFDFVTKLRYDMKVTQISSLISNVKKDGIFGRWWSKLKSSVFENDIISDDRRAELFTEGISKSNELFKNLEFEGLTELPEKYEMVWSKFISKLEPKTQVIDESHIETIQYQLKEKYVTSLRKIINTLIDRSLLYEAVLQKIQKSEKIRKELDKDNYNSFVEIFNFCQLINDPDDKELMVRAMQKIDDEIVSNKLKEKDDLINRIKKTH